jgi:aspartate kinase
MHGVTNQLIELTKQFCSPCHNREYDAVISSGEQVAAGLLSMCLCSAGIPAKSFNAWQIPILAGGEFSNSSISSVCCDKILGELDAGVVPVITGFQGINDGAICTIGRGGSDATACAVANSIDADRCFIYTDVDGVYTADPRISIDCRRLDAISYDEMYELSLCGATVLQARSVLAAKKYGIEISVVSSFSDGGGTVVADSTSYVSTKWKIAGIAHHSGVTVATVKKQGDICERCLASDALFIRRISDNKYIIPQSIKGECNADYDDDVGLVTMVGRDLGNCAGLTEEAISSLSSQSISTKATLCGELSVSLVVPRLQTELAVNTIHKMIFG